MDGPSAMMVMLPFYIPVLSFTSVLKEDEEDHITGLLRRLNGIYINCLSSSSYSINSSLYLLFVWFPAPSPFPGRMPSVVINRGDTPLPIALYPRTTDD